MLYDGCNKISHCNCYTPHIKQVQGVLETDHKFQNPKKLFTYPDTSETIQTLQKKKKKNIEKRLSKKWTTF